MANRKFEFDTDGFQYYNDNYVKHPSKSATTGTSGAHPYNGMGKKVLKKNMVSNVNTLTQAMINTANTIYVIQYDFTLGADITVPANCVLEFEGGSISANDNNDTITGNNTGIQAGLVKIFNTDITLSGTWNVAEAYPEWFGAKGDGVTDDRESLQKTIDYFDNIFIAGKVYLIKSVKQVTFRYNNVNEGIDETRIWNVGLTIPTFVKIKGVAKQDLKSTLKAGATMDAVVFAFDVADVFIDGVMIHGGGTYLNRGIDAKTNYGLYLRGCNCVFNKLDVRYCKLDGIYVSGFLVTYTECDVHEVQGNGFTLTYHEGNGTTHKLRGCTCDTVRKAAWNVSHVSYSLFMNNACDESGFRKEAGSDTRHPEDELYPVYNLNNVNTTTFISCGSERSYLLLKATTACTNLTFVSLMGALLLEPNTYDFTKVVDIEYSLGTRFINCDFKMLRSSGDTRSIEEIMGVKTFIYLANLATHVIFDSCSVRDPYFTIIDRTYICGENNTLDASVKILPEDFDYAKKISIPVQGNASVANLRGPIIDINQNNDISSLHLTDLVGVCNYQYIGSVSSSDLQNQSIIKNVNKINFNDCYFILASTYSGNNAAILIENSVVYLNNCIIQQSGSIPEGSTIATSYFKLINSVLVLNNPRFLGPKPIKTFECDKNSSIYINAEKTDEFELADPENCTFIVIGDNNREFPISNGSTFYNKLNGRYEYVINNVRADYDGAQVGVLRSGTFANKPSASAIYIGFKYFCTDKQTVEGATDGIEIIHKGNNVWVDALGRVVS